MVKNTIKIIENYVDEVFEEEVLKLLPSRVLNHERRNAIRRYGEGGVYKTDMVSGTIPDIFLPFKKDIEFNSVSINDYRKGQHIGFHIDKPEAGKKIYIISVAGDATLVFRNRITKEPDIEFNIPRFSLLYFADELRDEWMHDVVIQDPRRVSIVFRNYRTDISKEEKQKYIDYSGDKTYGKTS